MNKTKKVNLLKAIMSAISVAVFCFVLSFCVGSKKSENVQAAGGVTSTTSAGSFIADLELDEKLSKTLTFAQSTMYGDYTFFKDNEIDYSLAYSIDCSTSSDEDDVVILGSHREK